MIVFEMKIFKLVNISSENFDITMFSLFCFTSRFLVLFCRESPVINPLLISEDYLGGGVALIKVSSAIEVALPLRILGEPSVLAVNG